MQGHILLARLNCIVRDHVIVTQHQPRGQTDLQAAAVPGQVLPERETFVHAIGHFCLKTYAEQSMKSTRLVRQMRVL